jgi:LysM repeat protein
MNRKSTVLIAALVNSVFLVALFSTAARTHEKAEEIAAPQLQPGLHAEMKHEPPKLSTDGPGHVAPQTGDGSPLLGGLPELKESAPLPTAPAQKAKPVPAVKPKKSEPTFIEIEVKKGDVLERLARANQTTVSELMEMNGLKSPWLKIGQKLRVPRKATTLKKDASGIDSSPEFYTVKKGDNLWIIASKFKVSVSDLKRLNHLDDESAKRLKVNDQLRIR